MPSELFTASFLFADDVSVDCFLGVLFRLLGMSVSSLIGVALAFFVQHSPASDKVFGFANNLVVGCSEVILVLFIESSAKSTNLVTVVV